jgi:putative NADH-flavin reductase
MKVLVLGATGGTGQEVASQALEKGHLVTAFVRDPSRLKFSADRLRVLTGTVTGDGAPLATAIRGQDVVISALGRGKSLKSEDLMAQSMPAIVRAMENEGVRRLIFTSAYGVGVTWRDVPPLGKIVIKVFLRNLYADKLVGEAELQRSVLDWTLVYPVQLTNGPRTGRYRFGERLELHGLPRVSRADVADFILTQVDDWTYVRKGVIVSN